jgi:hypothetical protein
MPEEMRGLSSSLIDTPGFWLACPIETFARTAGSETTHSENRSPRRSVQLLLGRTTAKAADLDFNAAAASEVAMSSFRLSSESHGRARLPTNI